MTSVRLQTVHGWGFTPNTGAGKAPTSANLERKSRHLNRKMGLETHRRGDFHSRAL
jgi:hypothetical protein